MADELRPQGSAVGFVRAVVRREAGKALECVDVDRPPADAAVHDARKRLKRVRAALRLIRKPLGRTTFRRENDAFREAARPLSGIRDAKVVVETIDALLRRAPQQDRESLQRVREMLVSHRARVRQRASQSATMKPVVGALRSARDRAEGWSLKRGGPSALLAGVRRVYRSGRNALATALSDPNDDTLHE